MAAKLRIGTRGSRLALVQTEMVLRALQQHAPGLEAEIVKIQTSGDWKPEQGEAPLPPKGGGKAHFAKEIEEALLAGKIDCGVHSLKDMASELPKGLVIDHVLPRADPRDVFLANDYKTIDDLPTEAVVGTSSPRRRAFLLARRRDLEVVYLRGNVPTRIEKLRERQVDATLLALAGLQRLGLEHEAASVLEIGDMLPCAGQGIVGIELRQDDKKIHTLFDSIHCEKTGLCAAAERAAVAVLGGSCHTPIGAHASLNKQAMTLAVMLASPDGKQIFDENATQIVSTVAQAREFGARLGRKIKDRAPAELLTG
jgi:hydroxymethylbilane synthase